MSATMTSTDPRLQLHAALDQASRVLAGVTSDQLSGPTPCTEFDVFELGKHMVGVARRVAGIGRRQPQAGGVDTSGIPDNGLSQAFDAARDEALGAWADATLLEEVVVLPFATLPGAVVARIYLLELATHAWDLASATGQVGSLDPALAEAALAVATEFLPPEPRGGEFPFEAVVAVPEDAPAYDRLAGYLGRMPA